VAASLRRPSELRPGKICGFASDGFAQAQLFDTRRSPGHF